MEISLPMAVFYQMEYALKGAESLKELKSTNAVGATDPK